MRWYRDCARRKGAQADRFSQMLSPGQIMVCCAVALLGMGVVMVNSAGLAVGTGEPITPAEVLTSRPAIYAGLAILAMLIGSLLPVRSMARSLSSPPGDASDPPGHHLGVLAIGTLVLIAVLASVYVPGLGRSVYGSHRWIGLTLPEVGYVSVQPSEIVKWAMIGVIAWHAGRSGAHMASFLRGLVPGLLAVGAVAAVMVVEDLGTAVLIVAASGVMLLAGGARVWHVLALAPMGAVAVAGAIAIEPYRFGRLRTFLDPYADPEGTGYQMIQSMATVAGGQGWGRGLGNGIQKFGYLPEDQTDFLLAIIAEELGIAGPALIIVLLIGIVWSGWLIARREPEPVLALAVLGVVTTIGLQAIINIAVVTGWAPTKGIPLPLVSAGGTGWILTAASIGLCVSIDRSRRDDGNAIAESSASPPGAAASHSTRSTDPDSAHDDEQWVPEAEYEDEVEQWDESEFDDDADGEQVIDSIDEDDPWDNDQEEWSDDDDPEDEQEEEDEEGDETDEQDDEGVSGARDRVDG